MKFKVRLNWILAFVAIALLTRCAGQGRPEVPHLTIAFQSHRFLELEPCGCSLEDLGGVEREFNLLASWKQNSRGAQPLIFSAGSTFVPMASFDPKNKSHYAIKAEFLVTAMNELGIQYLSPSADDMAIGLDAVRALEKKAKFKFISANLADNRTGKPLFAPSDVISVGGKRILLVGITHGKTASYPIPREVQVRDPRAGIREALQAAGTVDMTIVISSVAAPERRALMAAFPEVELWLGGGPDEDSTYVATQPAAHQLYANSHQRGRGMMTLDVELVPGAKAFFNPAVERIYRSFREQAALELSEAEKAVAAEKTLGKKPALEKHLADTRARVAQLDKYPRSANGAVSVYEAKSLPVSSAFAKPTNPLTELINQYKKATKKLAMDESH